MPKKKLTIEELEKRIKALEERQIIQYIPCYPQQPYYYQTASLPRCSRCGSEIIGTHVC